jgi:hypothetical protein
LRRLKEVDETKTKGKKSCFISDDASSSYNATFLCRNGHLIARVLPVLGLAYAPVGSTPELRQAFAFPNDRFYGEYRFI